MNPIAIDLGIFQIYWYSITLFLAMFVGSMIVYKEMRKQNIKDDFIINLIFYAIIIGIVGARIYFVIFNLDYYIKYPIEILEIWNGGLAIHGGILFGIIWFVVYSNKNKINILKLLDITVLGLIIAQAIGRWGNFFNQEAHGIAVAKETLQNYLIPNFIINGMNINGIYYHPTFYYEFLWNVLGFIIMIILRKKNKLYLGQLTGFYFMWYSFVRFFIEGMRTDSLMIGSIRIAQLISIMLFIIGLYLFKRENKDTRVKRLTEKEN